MPPLLCLACDRVARPTKLTSERRRQIIELVRDGNYVEVAARASGIAPSTLYEWKARGEEGGPGNERFVEFLESLTRAEAEAETAGVAAIRGAWTKDWRSAIEYLARRYPRRWAKDRQHPPAEDGGPGTIAELMALAVEEDKTSTAWDHR